MVKGIRLDEIITDKDTSKEKRRFLELCAKRIIEAVDIWTEQYLDFDIKLAENKNPHSLIIEGSKFYDAEVRTGRWCYISSVHTREGKYKPNIDADRESFSFRYKGQSFKINYGEVSRKKK